MSRELVLTKTTTSAREAIQGLLKSNSHLKRSASDSEYKTIQTQSLGSDTDCVSSPNGPTDRRVRREIANSNERRRMQSINSGFQSLKAMLPVRLVGNADKLSKAGILQHAGDYIFTLEQEKTRLLHQVCTLRTVIVQSCGDGTVSDLDPPPGKRNKMLRDPSLTKEAEILEEDFVTLQREMIELRCQLDRERKQRMTLEACCRNYEMQNLSSHDSCKQATKAESDQASSAVNQRLVAENDRLSSENRQLTCTVSQLSNQIEEMTHRIENKPPSVDHCGLYSIVEAIKHVEGLNSRENLELSSTHQLKTVSTEQNNNNI